MIWGILLTAYASFGLGVCAQCVAQDWDEILREQPAWRLSTSVLTVTLGWPYFLFDAWRTRG